MTYEKDPARLANSLHNLKVLYDAGIPIAMGTDNMLEMMGGDVEHKELAYYVEAGLTPMEAITLATGNAARHLGIEDRKGFVKEGMEADLILLDQDPSQDISNIQFIHQVFCKGKIVYSQNVIQSYDIPEFHYPASLNQIRLTSTDGKEEKILDVSGIIPLERSYRGLPGRVFFGLKRSARQTGTFLLFPGNIHVLLIIPS